MTMSADRRALVIGSWSKGRERPTPQRVRSLTDRWNKIFVEDKFKFRSLSDPTKLPDPIHNPTVGQLTTLLTDKAKRITVSSELLIYFVGHSVSEGHNDIKLILGNDDDGNELKLSLAFVLSTINHSNIKKLVMILDTCHAGRTDELFRTMDRSVFVMFGGGDAYAFDGIFSDGILRALEQPLRPKDQRVDKRAGGITFQKVFEFATDRVLTENATSNRKQTTKSYGDYGKEVLLDAPVTVPEEFNPFAASRSVYSRLFKIIQHISNGNHSVSSLRSALGRDSVFIIRRNEDGRPIYLSKDRLGDYIDFLRKAKWVVQPSGTFKLTRAGDAARKLSHFNKQLLGVIESEIFSGGINLENLDEIIKDLLNDMIPPTPVQIKQRAQMKGRTFKLDPPTRLALQLLPSTGRFMKGTADAVFPSEPGGEQGSFFRKSLDPESMTVQ
jgi:hypothetical protein